MKCSYNSKEYICTGCRMTTCGDGSAWNLGSGRPRACARAFSRFLIMLVNLYRNDLPWVLEQELEYTCTLR